MSTKQRSQHLCGNLITVHFTILKIPKTKQFNKQIKWIYNIGTPGRFAPQITDVNWLIEMRDDEFRQPAKNRVRNAKWGSHDPIFYPRKNEASKPNLYYSNEHDLPENGYNPVKLNWFNLYCNQPIIFGTNQSRKE